MSTGAAIIGALRAVFGADTAAFEDGIDRVHKEMKKTERSFKKFGEKLSGIGQSLSLGITAPILAISAASIATASDMQELESAFDVTFRGASDSVRKWAEETGNTLGRSTKEIQESAVAFQSLFGKALAPEQATELTKEFSVLVQDLASFKNLSNEVAQQKLFSGLTGEAEPLRSVGVFINEAAVSTKALELGLEKVNGKYTDQQKIVARAALIQEQLSEANGDVVRTFDSTENQLKRASAAFEEFRVTIGTQLLPIITPLIEKVADALTWFGQLPEPIINATLVVAGLAAAIGPLVMVIGSLITTFAPLLAGIVASTAATTAFGAAITLATGPVGLMVAAVGFLIGALVLLARQHKINEAARKDLYDLIAENEELVTRDKASTYEQAKANLEEARTIRERLKARLEERRERLKDAQESLARKNARIASRGNGGISLKNRRMVAQAAADVAAAEEALAKNQNLIAQLSDEYAILGIAEQASAEDAKKVAKAQADAAKAAKEMAKQAKKLAEGHTDASRNAKDEIDQNTKLTAALRVSQKEYDITAASIALVKDGYRGTKDEIRAMAQEVLASRQVLEEAKEARQTEIDAEKAIAAAIKETEDARKQAAEDAKERHDDVTKSIEQEIDNNKLLTEAMKISTREYMIQVEVIRMLESGYKGTAAEARALAEELIASQEKLDQVTASTQKTEDALKKTGKTGVDAFTSTANSFAGLLRSIKSGDLEGILGGVLSVLEQIGLFGEEGSGSGSGGGFAGIIKGIGSLFGGFKANGGPVKAGMSYIVGERGPELFTAPGNGNIVPNDKLGGGIVKVVVQANEYFDARVDERAAGIAGPVSEYSSVQSVSQYNKAANRRTRQRLR